MDSSKRKILITGSAVRIGRAIAKSFKNAHLLLHYHRSEKEALSLKEELSKNNVSSSLYEADLRNKKEIENLFDRIQKEHQHIDVLINNAASFEKKPFLDISDFNSQIDLNLIAPLILSQKAAKMMRERSCIINLCDITSKEPIKGHTLHAISKAALLYATKTLALELAPRIRVNNLLVGIALPSADYDTKEIERIIDQKVSLKRPVSFQEINRSIHFIIENEYLSGATIELDGNWN